MHTEYSQVILLRMRPIRSEPIRAHLDDIDKAVIRRLQEDGRMSYAELGPLVGLSPAAARQRVIHLIDSGVMQVVAVTDPTRLGFDIQAMVGFQVTGDLEEIAGRLAQIPEVEYLVITTGRFDFLAEILATTTDHFLSVLNSIRSMPGVASSEVFTYLRLEKQSYDWGVR